jgi:3-oxoacyl-[acyl-carrier protein] reductase
MSGALLGKVALVTGASRGIGRCVAQALGREGCDLVLGTTRRGALDPLLRELTALKRRAVGVAADVGQPEGVDALVDAAQRAFGQVDVLVNNAAIAPRAALERMEDGLFERVLAVNLSGPFRLCRRIAPGMVNRGYGRIVNISSISGTLGTPGMTAYCASKWGLNGLTQSLSEEVKGKGVFVSAVLPGTVRTEMSRDLGFPVQMEPEDVAELVRYLCAEAPAAMAGSLVEMFG